MSYTTKEVGDLLEVYNSKGVFLFAYSIDGPHGCRECGEWCGVPGCVVCRGEKCIDRRRKLSERFDSNK